VQIKILHEKLIIVQQVNKFLAFFLNQNFHYCVHKCSSVDTHFESVQSTPHLFKSILIISYICTEVFQLASSLHVFVLQFLYECLISLVDATCLANHILFDSSAFEF
jgi:hypothetical protein